MKKIILLTFLFASFSKIMSAQSVGIGTNTPNASSILEIKASNKGLLIPRTSTTSRTAIVNPAKGLMVYDTTTSSFWFHNGSAWVQMQASGTGWSLLGNAGTNSSTNFIGTTDSKPLTFKINNVKAGFIDTTTQNTGIGFKTLDSTVGYGNTANGYEALLSNTTGYSNVAIGTNALFNNTDRSNLVAIGDSALYNNGNDESAAIYGTGNTAVGSKSLFSNTIGYQNTASGYAALYSNINGSQNNAYGTYALYLNTSGSSNTASGDNALYANTTGYTNTANGYSALQFNIDGFSNTASGVSSLGANESGNNNTANGYASLANTTGSGNTADGSGALHSNTIGNDNTALGKNADVSNSALTNATAIGANAKVGTSNTIQLGDVNVASVSTFGDMSAHGYSCRAGGNGAFSGNAFNINWSGGAAQLWIDVTNLGTISFTSDRRLKENIDLMKGNGIERMMELKPVHFKYKKIEGTVFYGSSQEQEGFIADELQQVIPSAVNGEKNALTSKGTIQPQTINIVPVVAVLTKAVQEQQQIIEDQNKKIDLQQQKINALLTDMEQLKQKLNTPVK